MKEEDLIKLGFKFHSRYEHDDFYTNRYVKGILQVEFTYTATNKQISTDVTIEEINCMPITLEEIKVLIPVFCKSKHKVE